ncbi:metal-dependent hydrolase [Halovivax gelatinilyticus]|uniref:metal-dependent hydrolase n=1 Tax=Halovivax gelatinilyticus TaxID=2961597 RepID=UPI0020CA5CC8|nr:metal-dependent hydrolase [Halovivax gelatinilyticus]
MWPLGHLAVAYLLYALARRVRSLGPPLVLPVVALAIGSQFPDLVDKPLAWYLGALPTGRTLAHSLLVLVPVSIVVYAATRRLGRSELGVAFAIGALSHALVDALPALWGAGEARFLLWPVLSVEPYETGVPSIAELFRQSLGDPYFLSEFVLAAIALYVWRGHGYPGTEPVIARIQRTFGHRT